MNIAASTKKLKQTYRSERLNIRELVSCKLTANCEGEDLAGAGHIIPKWREYLTLILVI